MAPERPTRADLVAVVRGLRTRIDAVSARVGRQVMAFSPVSGGAVTVTGSFASTHVSVATGGGSTVGAVLLAACGADGVVEARVSIPALPFTGSTVASGVGGDQVIRLSDPLPEWWADDNDFPVYVEARRSVGAASCSVRVARAWLR